MSESLPIQEAVEAYLSETGMAPTTFGQRALSDRHFVRQLREGREVRRRTRERILAFIAANPPSRTQGEAA